MKPITSLASDHSKDANDWYDEHIAVDTVEFIKHLSSQAVSMQFVEFYGDDREDRFDCIFGVADGRWTYENNLEGAFGTEEERKIWCGNNEEVQVTYNALLLALKDNHDAHFILDYTECELGVGFVGRGEVFIKYDEDTKGVEAHIIRQDGGEVNIDNLISYGFASDEQDAKEME